MLKLSIFKHCHIFSCWSGSSWDALYRTMAFTALNQHWGYMSLMSRPTIVQSSCWKSSFSNCFLRPSKFLSVWHSKLTPAHLNVHLIDFEANLFKHWVKLCTETMRHVGGRPFYWIGLWSLIEPDLGSYVSYKFSQPPGSYVETCTSFYVFSGPRWLTSLVG